MDDSEKRHSSCSETFETSVDECGLSVGQVLNTLNALQLEYKYIPPNMLNELSQKIGVPYARLYSICTNFDRLSFEPVGDHLIEVCDGTACHTQGSARIINKICEVLGIKVGQTLPDGSVSLRCVNCVGACSQAPLMIVDGILFGKVRLDTIDDVISPYVSGEC